MGKSLKDYTKKPASIKRLEKVLQERLVGKVIPYVLHEPDPIIGAVRHSEVEIAKYLEEATHTLAAEDERVRLVVTEPNGGRTFPDLLICYRNGYKQAIEVKSWLTSRNFDVAKMKPLHASLLSRDPKYFKTWYVIWSYSKEADGYRILSFELQRIWQVVGWTKTLDAIAHYKKDEGGHTALRPGMSSFLTPVELLFAIVGTTVTDPVVQCKMFEQGLAMLEAEDLYRQEDMLVLKNRVRGAGAMREPRHDFIFDF